MQSEINATNEPDLLVKILVFVRLRFSLYSPKYAIELERYIASKLETLISHEYFSSFGNGKSLYRFNPIGRDGSLRSVLYLRMHSLPQTFWQRMWLIQETIFSLYVIVFPRLVGAQQDKKVAYIMADDIVSAVVSVGK